IVMTGDHNNSITRAGELGNDIVNREFAFRCVHLKIVLLDCVTLEMCKDVILDLLVVRASNRTRTEGHDFLYVLHGPIGVERGRGLWRSLSLGRRITVCRQGGIHWGAASTRVKSKHHRSQ